jgi:hypothetical protein
MMHLEFHTLELPNPHVSYPHPFSSTFQGPHENTKLNPFEGPQEGAKTDLFEGPALRLRRYPPGPLQITGQSLARVPLCLHLMTTPPGCGPAPSS